ncbi:hypothetical protein BEH_07460 [Priestia filamentosa]|uniref:Uncharacterized protein n=1 Tax=Priestia filamentosa TaxID=1402861 RepID=A0A0H4KEA8_9BACI|nr:hypothetical protein [Priestia filamentosa]AKO91950.1 hypothetical protein BEH_07460 [Priestia filamentosa]
MILKVFKTENKIERDKTMDELNEWGAKVFNDAYKYYSDLARNENENVFKIFDDWWKGKCVSTEEYMSKHTKENNDLAYGIIMTAISNGFG